MTKSNLTINYRQSCLMYETQSYVLEHPYRQYCENEKADEDQQIKTVYLVAFLDVCCQLHFHTAADIRRYTDNKQTRQYRHHRINL